MVLVALYGLCALALLVRYDGNPSVLFRFGHYYADQNPQLIPPGALVFLGEERFGGNGYDGQIFYYYSRTLFVSGEWPVGFNNAYRAPRVGFPLFGAPFVPLGSWAVLSALVLSQLALILAGGLAFHRLLPEGGKAILLLYVLSPFMLQSALLMVSDSIVAALLLCGLYFYCGGRSPFDREGSGEIRLEPIRLPWMLAAWLIFAWALLTKESSVFLLAPLGLHALWIRDIRRAGLLIATLVPYVAWQLYLREAHGMVPAGVLRVFLSPLDGILGLTAETGRALAQVLRLETAGVVALAKLSARGLLVLLIGTAAYAAHFSIRRRSVVFGAAVGLSLASVLIADHYYFWSVYENISRMFTPLVITMALLVAADRTIPVRPFVWVFGVLTVMVVARALFFVPAFPYEPFEAYVGPSYTNHAPVPGRPVR